MHTLIHRVGLRVGLYYSSLRLEQLPCPARFSGPDIDRPETLRIRVPVVLNSNSAVYF